MQIALGTVTDENHKVSKNFNQGVALSGTMRDDSSIIRPVIECQFSPTGITYNYMYIPDFSRYYYIEDIIYNERGLYEFHGRVDVLMSFASEIRANTAVIDRNTFNWNLYLDDGSLRSYADPYIIFQDFPAAEGGFPMTHDDRYILITAGVGGTSAPTT